MNSIPDDYFISPSSDNCYTLQNKSNRDIFAEFGICEKNHIITNQEIEGDLFYYVKTYDIDADSHTNLVKIIANYLQEKYKNVWNLYGRKRLHDPSTFVDNVSIIVFEKL